MWLYVFMIRLEILSRFLKRELMRVISWKYSKNLGIHYIRAACFITRMMRLNLLIITKKNLLLKKSIDNLIYINK